MPVEGVIASLKQRLPRLPYTVVNPVVREGLKPRFIVRIHEVVVPWYLRVRDLIQSSSRMAWLQDVAIVSSLNCDEQERKVSSWLCGYKPIRKHDRSLGPSVVRSPWYLVGDAVSGIKSVKRPRCR